MGVPIRENLRKGADSVWAYAYNSVEETENVSNHNGKTGEFRTQIL